MGRATYNRRLIVGVALISVGLLLLVAVGAYYGLGRYNASKLPEYTARVQGPVALPEVPLTQQDTQHRPSADTSTKPVAGAVNPFSSEETAPRHATDRSAERPSPVTATSKTRHESPTPSPAAVGGAQQETQAGTAELPEYGGDLVSTYNSIYPGLGIHPKYWDRPLLAGSDTFTYGVVVRPDGFVSLSALEGVPRGQAADAVHIRIPSIKVDSEVSNLAILELGDSRQYETPVRVVGRIPETSNPGELGNTWLFGHLESPIKGEGNVFHRLPEIPGLLKNGDPVYVSLLNADDDEYLYQVTESNVVHQDDLALYDTDDSTVTLVACVPRLVYDHRILITGKLVGVKRAGA